MGKNQKFLVSVRFGSLIIRFGSIRVLGAFKKFGLSSVNVGFSAI